MSIKLAPQVINVLADIQPPNPNQALVRLWHDVQQQKIVEQQAKLRPATNAEAQPTTRRVRFNRD